MSYIQLGETCPDVIKINNKIEYLKDKKVTTKPNILLRKKLVKLRLENQKKINKIKALKLANLRIKNQKKRDKIKSLKLNKVKLILILLLKIQ